MSQIAPHDAAGLVDVRAEGSEARAHAAAGEAWSRELLAMQSAVTAAGDDLDAVMNAVVNGATRVMPHADGAVIEMREGNELVFRAASGAMVRAVGLRLKIGQSVSGRCILSGEPQVCVDSELDPYADRELCRRAGVRSLIAVPLPFQGEHVGVLKIYSGKPSLFDSRDLLTAQLLAGPITIGMAGVAQAAAARARAEADKRFAATFEQAAVGIAHVAPDGRFLLVNDRFRQIVGYARHDLIVGGFQQITHPDDLNLDLENFAALIAGRIDHYSMEKRYVRKNGTLVWVNLTISLVRHADGTPDFFVSVIEDISARKAAEKEAAHDELTGLLNRRGLVDALSLELMRHRVAGRPLAVAYLDLDGFKAINDRYGHAEGDRCLTKVAAALRVTLRPEDQLARFGGDEFVVLLPAIFRDSVERMLAGLCDAVAAAAEGEPWRLAVSAGAVSVPPDATADALRIIASADNLMYRVKHSADRRPIITTFGAAA